jgi:hypothetical protein
VTIRRLHVIARTERDAYEWAHAQGIGSETVSPVTAPDQLRTVRTGGHVNVLVHSSHAYMPPSLWAAFRAQLSIRRAIGNITEISTEADLKSFRRSV